MNASRTVLHMTLTRLKDAGDNIEQERPNVIVPSQCLTRCWSTFEMCQ